MRQKVRFCSGQRQRIDTGTEFKRQESNYQIRIMFRFRGGRRAEISESIKPGSLLKSDSKSNY